MCNVSTRVLLRVAARRGGIDRQTALAESLRQWDGKGDLRYWERGTTRWLLRSARDNDIVCVCVCFFFSLLVCIACSSWRLRNDFISPFAPHKLPSNLRGKSRRLLLNNQGDGDEIKNPKHKIGKMPRCDRIR